MPEYLEGPDGPIRVPDDLPDAALATVVFVRPRGQEVEMLFIRKDEPELGPSEDGAVSEVVARVFMPRGNFERLVLKQLPRSPKQWRKMGI